MKVLIVDRDRTIQQSLSYFMGRHKGCEVFLASSRKEGVPLFESIPFDIVLCDDRLPDGNGFEMLREWAKQRPGLISILMTVRNDEQLRQEAMRSSIQGFLVKPFDLKELEEIIKAASDRSR